MVFFSCGESKPTSELDDIISKLKTEGSTYADSLLNYCARQISATPSAVNENSNMLMTAAEALESAGDYNKAAGVVVASLKQYYDAPNTAQRISKLVSLYTSLGNTDAANTTMNGYLQAFSNGEMAADYTAALGSLKQSMAEMLNASAQEIVNNPDSRTGLNTEAVRKYIGIAEINALTNADRDTMTMDYLFKAGKLAMTIGATSKTEELYRWIYQIFPNSKEGPAALFSHGFTLDTQLGKKQEAKLLYEQFIQQYPDHHFVDDAQFQLDNLGKTTEEIMKQFESN